MTNYQFGSDSAAPPYSCDSNPNSLLINGDRQPLNQNGTSEQHQTKTPSNSISIITFSNNGPAADVMSNQEKPPYCSTTMPINDYPPYGCTSRREKLSSILHVLHLISVVIASATINGVVFGVVNNFGVFYVYLIELIKSDSSLLSLSGEPSADEQLQMMTNNASANAPPRDALLQPLIAGVGSLNIGLIFFCSIFASVLSDRYGIRQVCFVGGVLSTIGMFASSVSINLIYLYITYGLVLGIGASLVYAPSLAILGHYFTNRLGLVNGLVTAGSSGFSIVMPIVLRRLIDSHGIPTTFQYLSILMATLIVCSLTFKETIPKSNSKAADSRRHGSKSSLSSLFLLDELWKNRLYLCWLISIPTGLFGYFVPFCHLVKHAQDIKSAYPGEVLVMAIGGFSLIGRLISGPLADFSHVNRIALQQIAFVSIGILTMSLTIVSDISLLVVCCGLGLFDGCFISLLGPIAFDLVGPENANQAIGLLLCFCSLPLTVGPPIAAYAYGIYGNYTLAFFLAGIPPIVAAVLMFNIIRLQRTRSRSFSALSSAAAAAVEADNLLTRNGHLLCGENGEKLHLLTNGGGSSVNSNSAGNISTNSSMTKLRLGENSTTTSVDLDSSSEHASLLAPKSSSATSHVMIQPSSNGAAPSSPKSSSSMA